MEQKYEALQTLDNDETMQEVAEVRRWSCYYWWLKEER